MSNSLFSFHVNPVNDGKKQLPEEVDWNQKSDITIEFVIKFDSD